MKLLLLLFPVLSFGQITKEQKSIEIASTAHIQILQSGSVYLVNYVSERYPYMHRTIAFNESGIKDFFNLVLSMYNKPNRDDIYTVVAGPDKLLVLWSGSIIRVTTEDAYGNVENFPLPERVIKKLSSWK